MSDSTTTRDTIIDSIKALPVADMWAVMESALKVLKTASKPAKAKKGKRDPNAPKRKVTWWVQRTLDVREALNEEIMAENAARKSRGENALPAIAAVRVTSMLRDAGKLSQDVMSSQEDILATWTAFLKCPPEPKPKPVKKSASVEPTEPAVSKSAKVKKELTDDEKAAKKEVAKMKKESKKTAPPPTPPPVDANDEPETEIEVDPYEWTFDFGKGEKLYERLDYEGKAYIYDNDSKAYLGLFMEKTKKLNTSAADPLA